MADWTMEWIGTGSGLNPALGNTCFLIRGKGDRVALIDCGYTVPGRLIELGYIDDITDLVITHMHSDHIGGLEAFGFYQRYITNNRGDKRPKLHIGSEKLAEILWDHALKAGMQLDQVRHGSPAWNTLDTYFNVQVGRDIAIPGLPRMELVPAPHIGHMENYAVRFENGVYYSGDTYELPPTDPVQIFQDCQFQDGNGAEVHLPYRRMVEELPPEVRAKTHLVHLSAGFEKTDAKADGFAGFVMPGDVFEY
jgi:glyoxylase-like metal-dependent hydrolase (beta-lactamase superfamily II)